MNAASQWSTIGWMIACGATMGTVFDFYRAASHRFHIRRWLLPALDIAFWAAATLGVFKVLLDHNNGEVRMYVFLGLGIGVTGYFGLFSAFVAKAADRFFRLLTQLAAGAWKMFRLLLVTPFFGIVRLLAKLLDIAFVVTAAIVLWTLRLLLVPLKPLGLYFWGKLLPVRRKARAGADIVKRWIDKGRRVWELLRKK